MIYTSYFGMLKKIPPEITPIAICRGIPRWYDGKLYSDLAPSYETLSNWRARHDEEAYKKDFYIGLFARDPRRTVAELQELAGTKDFVLLCYEKSGEFCHRHLVSVWLRINGIDCTEFVPAS